MDISKGTSLEAFQHAAEMSLSKDRVIDIKNDEVTTGSRSLAGKHLAMLRGFSAEQANSEKSLNAFQNALASKFGEPIARATVEEMKKQTGGVFVSKHVTQGLALAESITQRLRESPNETPESKATVSVSSAAVCSSEFEVSASSTPTYTSYMQKDKQDQNEVVRSFIRILRPTIDASDGFTGLPKIYEDSD